MFKVTAGVPVERFKQIDRIAFDVAAAPADPAFQVRLDPRGLTHADARRLPPCELVAGPRMNVDIIVDGDRGQWNMSDRGKDIPFVEGGKCTGHAVLVFDPRAAQDNVYPFLTKLAEMARQRGMELGEILGGNDIFGSLKSDALGAAQALQRAPRSDKVLI